MFYLYPTSPNQHHLKHLLGASLKKKKKKKESIKLLGRPPDSTFNIQILAINLSLSQRINLCIKRLHVSVNCYHLSFNRAV